MTNEQMLSDNNEKRKTLSKEITRLNYQWPDIERDFSSERRELEWQLGLVNTNINTHNKILEELSCYNSIIEYQEYGNDFGKTIEELENSRKIILSKIESMKSPEEQAWKGKILTCLYLDKVRENIGSYLASDRHHPRDFPYLAAQYNLAKTINAMSNGGEKEKYMASYMVPFTDWEQDLIDRYFVSYEAAIKTPK